jgi:hypothetical protein
VPRRSVGWTELCVLCFPAQGMGAFFLALALPRSGAVDGRLLPSFSFYSSVIPASFFLDLLGVADRIFCHPHRGYRILLEAESGCGPDLR